MVARTATWGWWWRAGMCTVWAVYLALAYMVARGAAGGWSGIGTVLLGLTGALAAAIFLLPLIALLDADDVVRVTRGARRFARGECPACGQPRVPVGGAGTADGGETVGGAGGAACAACAECAECAECGAEFVRPVQWVPSWTTAGRFAVVFGIALVCGCAAGEWRLRLDESDFRARAAGSSADWERNRPWPADFSALRYQGDQGQRKFSAPPPFESPRIPGWQPGRPR